MNKLINWLVFLVILVPGIYLALTWNQLPAKIPMHFDINGNADRFGNKQELLTIVLILPAFSLFIFLFIVVGGNIFYFWFYVSLERVFFQFVPHLTFLNGCL